VVASPITSVPYKSNTKRLDSKRTTPSYQIHDTPNSTVVIPNVSQHRLKKITQDVILEPRKGIQSSSKKQITIEEVLHRKQVQSRSIQLACRTIGEVSLNNERCWIIYCQGAIFIIHPRRWSELCMERFSKPYSMFSSDLFTSILKETIEPKCKHGHPVWIQIL
jgi:hypothetical protein